MRLRASTQADDARPGRGIGGKPGQGDDGVKVAPSPVAVRLDRENSVFSSPAPPLVSRRARPSRGPAPGNPVTSGNLTRRRRADIARAPVAKKASARQHETRDRHDASAPPLRPAPLLSPGRRLAGEGGRGRLRDLGPAPRSGGVEGLQSRTADGGRHGTRASSAERLEPALLRPDSDRSRGGPELAEQFTGLVDQPRGRERHRYRLHRRRPGPGLYAAIGAAIAQALAERGADVAITTKTPRSARTASSLRSRRSGAAASP